MMSETNKDAMFPRLFASVWSVTANALSSAAPIAWPRGRRNFEIVTGARSSGVERAHASGGELGLAEGCI